MNILLTQFAAEETSGIGALGINGKALIIQLVTFVLAFLVLKKFAFKPIIKVLDQRRELIESGVAIGEQMKKDKAELDETVAKTIAEARTKAEQIVSDAQETSRQTIREAEGKATEKAKGILKEADARIESETKRARKALEGELVGLISEATEAIIHEKVDAKKDAQLIEAALKGSKA